MEYLVALADEQQFTRAAALCHVSQSGLSAAIRGLEEELGTTLFDRTTRRVVPTDAGLALLPHARTMLAQAAAARDAVVRASHQLSGSLRVGAEQCLGMVDVNALLERVHLLHPLVELEFTQAGSHELVDRVNEGTLDVAFVAGGGQVTRLRRHELRGRTVQLKVRFADFTTITRAQTLPQATNITVELWRAADELLTQRLPKRRLEVRLLGMGVTGLDGSSQQQRMLFDEDGHEKQTQLDAVADQIRQQYGTAGLGRAATMLHGARHRPQPRPGDRM